MRTKDDWFGLILFICNFLAIFVLALLLSNNIVTVVDTFRIFLGVILVDTIIVLIKNRKT